MTVNMRVRTTLTYGSGGPGLHTVYWRPGTAGGVTADASDAIARVRAFWQGIRLAFATTMTMDVQTDVALIEDTSGDLVGNLSGVAAAQVIGAAAGGVGPLASMALARLRTGLVVNRRALKGRWFLGPISVSAQGTGGALSSGQVTAIDAAGLAMLSGGATASFPVVWHRPGDNPGVSSAITAVSTWSNLSVLRSRRDS
jgi:hypothetical protein